MIKENIVFKDDEQSNFFLATSAIIGIIQAAIASAGTIRGGIPWFRKILYPNHSRLVKLTIKSADQQKQVKNENLLLLKGIRKTN